MSIPNTSVGELEARLRAEFYRPPRDGVTEVGNTSAIATLRGPRDENQDRAFIARLVPPSPGYDPITVAAVLDGMGGMKDGDIAAAVAASRFLSSLATSWSQPLSRRLEAAIVSANAAVFEALRGDGGTTLTAIAFSGTTNACAGHAGDSRLYRSTAPGALEQVTTDDTFAGLLGESEPGDFEPDGLMQFVGIGASFIPQVIELSS